MWLRNIVCSVVTIAVVWAFAHYWHAIGSYLTTEDGFAGLGIYAALTFLLLSACYLIARTVDARAARQRGLRD